MLIFVGSQNIAIELIWPVYPESGYVLVPCFHTSPDVIYSICWTTVFKLLCSERGLLCYYSLCVCCCLFMCFSDHVFLFNANLLRIISFTLN